jgi:hypothetical protein
VSIEAAAATIPADAQALMWQGLVCFAITIGVMAGAFVSLVWFIICRQDKALDLHRAEAELRQKACREDSANMRNDIEHLRQRSFEKDMKTMEVMTTVARRLNDLRGAVMSHDDEDSKPTDVNSDSDLQKAIDLIHATQSITSIRDERYERQELETGKDGTTAIIRRIK